MAYNPGIAARGEVLGQSIGAAGQSIAQQYGEGLKLQEEQKRYNKQEKQRKKDRRDLEKSDLTQAKILARASMGEEAAKEFISSNLENWDAAEVRGWMTGQTESMKFKAHRMNYDLSVLKLGEYEDILKQKPIMRQAMEDMAMGTSEQSLSSMDSLDLAMSMNPDLSPANVLQLNKLVQARQSIQMEGKVLELRDAANQIAAKNAENSAETARIQGEQVALAKQKQDESERVRRAGPKARDVEGLSNYKSVTLPDGRTQLVEIEKDDTPDFSTGSSEGKSIAANTEELITDIDLISEGDDRYGLANMLSRNSHAMDQIKTITKKNREFKAKYGKDHPDIKRLQIRVVPFINKMKNSSDSTYKKLARQLARELGIGID